MLGIEAAYAKGGVHQWDNFSSCSYLIFLYYTSFKLCLVRLRSATGAEGVIRVNLIN